MRKQLLLWVFMLVASGGKAQTMQRYEYWFDNDYNSRITAEGSQQEVSLDIDISNVNSGLHYLNFRVQGDDGKWGGLSRYIVYLGTKSTQYEYWLDNDYAHRTVVDDVPSSSFSVDISKLSPGLHYFNFRTRNKGNRWGSLSRYMVYVENHLNWLSCINYWIDDDVKNVQTVQVGHNTVMLSIDISELTRGNHKLSYQGVLAGGRFALQEDLYFEATDWDDAIKAPTADTLTDDGCVFDLQGRKLIAPQKGINIVRHSDGTTRMVLMK